MTHFFLIRHAVNDLTGVAIAGWLPGVHLNPKGRQQAALLAEALAKAPIRHVFSSPLERARETAAPLAHALGLEVRTAEAIAEVRFGEWTGQRIDQLEADPLFRQWNNFRTGTRPPGGESMLEVQGRFVGFLQRLCTELPGESIALVSHGDAIRSALLYYLGMPLDFVHRLEVSPASVSTLAIGDSSAQLVSLNRCFDSA